jgi:IclR family transcriptional regulator, pca regulon regulatory protein
LAETDVLNDSRRSRADARNGEFVEALARGLDVITCFGPTSLELSVSDVASRTGLARPTARRLLLTLEQLGYVRAVGGSFSLTTQVLRLGTAGIAAQGIWDVARPHLVNLVGHTGESSSMSQLDGSDIVYTARVPVPKIIALAVSIGTLFPAVATSMGRVLLADLAPDDLEAVLATPSRSGVIPRVTLTRAELDDDLAEIRERGWALSDEMLSLGIRSIAAPICNREGRTVAAMNVTVHAAETSTARLLEELLPLLQRTAAEVSEDWALWQRRPHVEVEARQT